MSDINTSLKILIVADSSTVQRIIKSNLTNDLKMTNVKVAEDDSTAFQIIQNEIVDVIIALQHRGEGQTIAPLANHKHVENSNRIISLIACVQMEL